VRTQGWITNTILKRVPESRTIDRIDPAPKGTKISGVSATSFAAQGACDLT